MAFPSIALEEQFISSNATKVVSGQMKKYYDHYSGDMYNQLADISPDGARVKLMDTGNVNISVLSNVPGLTSCSPKDVIEANNELAAATEAQPRFKGFASLPMSYPEHAATELERCVRELRFVGALIDSHLDDGSYYDDARFWPVFAKAAELDVPIYLHPTSPTAEIQSALYEGNYSDGAAMILGIAGWGWHADTALAVLRMYSSGLFGKHPNLKIVIGHMGEMLPFMLDRIDDKLRQAGQNTKTTFREVWDRNIWVTTSGMFELPPMACLLSTTKIDHVLYSIDYPWSTNEQGKAFLEQLGNSGLISAQDLELVAYKNAERLLKIKAT